MMHRAYIASIGVLLLLQAACVQWKQTALYDQPTVDTLPSVQGFTDVSVFVDQMSNELWFTPAIACLNVTAANEAHTGSGALRIRWNNQAGGCPWLGMGIGWNNWSGKNFEAIVDSAALTFYVRNIEGSTKGLPWAVGFEDYEGGQAWTGVFPAAVQGGIVTTEWTKVVLPLSDFPFVGRDVNITAIKQVIFQFEASGEVLVDDIAIEAYTNKDDHVVRVPAKGEWSKFTLGPSRWALQTTDDSLLLQVDVDDDTPLMNAQSNKDIWNGDAIEMAFSSLPLSNGARVLMYPTDRHLGWKCGAQPQLWDWTRGRALPAFIQTSRTNGGYSLHTSVAWKDLGVAPWKPGVVYSAEFALDEGNTNGRTLQWRWNSGRQEGFNTNPSLWGKLIVEQ